MPLLDSFHPSDSTPFLWLHGFTQTRHSGYEFREQVSTTRDLRAFDLAGHGDASDLVMTLPQMGADIAESLGSASVDLGGYSFGGRVALHVALAAPAQLEHLVVLSATAGIADPEERRARRERDTTLASRIEEMGVESFLSEWLAQPMFSTLKPDPVELASRSHDAAGLASSLRTAGTGTQQPLDEALSTLLTPSLIVAGERDEKFVREAHRLHECLRNSELVIVPEAGHALHLERPDYVAALVSEYLRR